MRTALVAGLCLSVARLAWADGDGDAMTRIPPQPPPAQPPHPIRSTPKALLSFGPYIPYTGEEIGLAWPSSASSAQIFVGWQPGLLYQIDHSRVAIGGGVRLTWGDGQGRAGVALRLAWITDRWGVLYLQGGPIAGHGLGWDAQAGLELGFAAIYAGAQRDDFSGAPTAYVGVRVALVEGIVAILATLGSWSKPMS